MNGRNNSEETLAALGERDTGDGGSVSFGEVLLLWLSERRAHCKGATMAKYRYLSERHILPQLGQMPVEEVSGGVLRRFLCEKSTGGRLDGSGGLSPAYLGGILHVIAGVLGYAAQIGVARAPATPARPSPTKKELVVLGEEAQRRLETAILARPDPTGLGVLLALRMGLRLGEVCALHWDDVDIERRSVHVRYTISRVEARGAGTTLVRDRPKTAASAREIPLPAPLLSLLGEGGLHAPGKFVASGEVSFLSPRTFQYRYHRLLARLKLSPVHFHALRHTFATRCVEAGVDAKSLSEILGHTSVNLTLGVYVHSSLALKRAQLEKLSSLSSLA